MQVKSVVDGMNGFCRQLDPLIDERIKQYATSPDTCPDDLLTAMIKIQPPVSDSHTRKATAVRCGGAGH